MTSLLNERVFYYFEKISAIPRESGNEMAVSNWIYDWTKTLGLEAAQDAAFNLVIRKKASAGYETAAPVILQAHMDMVCEKTLESSHDFSRDPILLKTEGDWLMSACGTTLGADNGIGVACAMAILEDQLLVHPPLEVIFTVEEETTFKGANAVAANVFTGRRMINLDHADDGELVAGSCGGTGVSVVMPLEWEKEVPNGYTAFKVKIGGLEGGHSGEDIHRGRGNATQLLVRFLQRLNGYGCKVCSICGGTNRLAICREAEAVVLADSEEKLRSLAEEMQAVYRKEFGQAAPRLDMKVENVSEETMILPLKAGQFTRIASMVRLFPDGILGMSGELTGQVNSSDNLGILRTCHEKQELQITSEIRGMYQSMVEDTREKINMLADLMGAKVEYFADYVPWEYAADSRLRSTALSLYQEMYGESMRVSTVHAGLEGGMFTEKAPGMDIISVGPSCQFFHSPLERVSLSSVRKFYGFLKALLAELE